MGFFTMFALFFPAATGIMAGANMSGDLADPARSIPRGTLASIGVTAAVYCGMALLLAAAAPREALIGDEMIVGTLAWSSPLVTVGVFSATLSSAIASMMGAPRVLQALARDKIFTRLEFFGIGSAASNEPRRATVLTFLIAEAGILIGDLDVIAPIITMFFMVTYGYLNLATFAEAYTRNPSYRPTFKYTHWSLALVGALSCLAVMLSHRAAVGPRSDRAHGVCCTGRSPSAASSSRGAMRGAARLMNAHVKTFFVWKTSAITQRTGARI